MLSGSSFGNDPAQSERYGFGAFNNSDPVTLTLKDRAIDLNTFLSENVQRPDTLLRLVKAGYPKLFLQLHRSHREKTHWLHRNFMEISSGVLAGKTTLNAWQLPHTRRRRFFESDS